MIEIEKTQFIYQRWYLRIFCSGIMFPLIFVIQYLFAMLLDIEYANFGYMLICSIVAFVGFAIYYKHTQHHKWFERKGAYWVENGIVYIQKQNKIYELKNVKWLRGTTVSAYGIAKSGMLIIQFEKRKIIIVSSSTTDVETFSDSELLYLFEMILECNTELKKDDTLDFWYEIKE